MSRKNNRYFNPLPIDSPSNKHEDLLSKYTILKILGRGAFSIVKLGEHKITKKKVAIKIMKKNKIINQDDLIRLDREIQMLKSLNHENIIKIYNILEDSETFYIIMEYCENGELFNRIVEKKRLSEDESAIFYYQLINGLDYIHKKNIIHRDLKPENLLLTKDDILKIIDFGLSNYSKYNIFLNTPCGSPSYASPEMINGQKYNGFLTDIWSTGIILFAMICGYLPFEDNNKELLFEKIYFCKINYPEYIGKLPLDLLKKIIVFEPSKRITLEQIKQHPFYLKGKLLFNQKYAIKNNNKKKISVKSITPTNNYKTLKNILKNECKLKGQLDISIKNLNNEFFDYYPCISENNDKIIFKDYKLNETENCEKHKKIDNEEEEKNVKGNTIKNNVNNYKNIKINQTNKKINYKFPTDSVPKNQKYVSRIFDSSNSKKNEEKEREMKSKKSTEKMKINKKVENPHIIEASNKNDNIFEQQFITNGAKTVKNKITIKKLSKPKNKTKLMERNNHTMDLDYEHYNNNVNNINFICTNRVNKVSRNQESVSSTKNKDKLIYSIDKKSPKNNHKKKNIFNINLKKSDIYESNTFNYKYNKENNNINLTNINRNDKKKIIYFVKKKLITSFNEKTNNTHLTPDKFYTFNLNKEKKDKVFSENNSNAEKFSKINNYFSKVLKILQNKYNDSQLNDKNIKYKRIINVVKLKNKKHLNISPEKGKENSNINGESKNIINNNTVDYNDNKETKSITNKNFINFSNNKNNKINEMEPILYKKIEKNSLEDEKSNNDYSKYKQNINNRLETDIKFPKNNNKSNVLDIKNIRQNMKFYQNSNYIIYNNNINRNNKSTKEINNLNENNISNKSNKSKYTNYKKNKLLKEIKIKNSYQTYDLNNSNNTNNCPLIINGIYFDAKNRNREESLNYNTFKNMNTQKRNFIKKVVVMNNKKSNIIRNNNKLNRNCDNMNNNSKRLNLTTKHQRKFKTKYGNLNNDSNVFEEKSHFLFDKINNINELQKTYCETQNYNAIINIGNDTHTFPYTNHIDNAYPLENCKRLNTIGADMNPISTIGQKISSTLEE